MAEVHGFCDERFQSLADAFARHQDERLDVGASLAVELRGEPVVDLWGGWRDYALEQPWERDTLVRVFSTSKVLVIITVLMLVDRGELDLDEPIATHWPEFARHGKGAITPKHVLLHQAGLPGFGRPMTLAQLGDAELMASVLEDAELWFEPGTNSCYHFHTYGHLLGEVARRVSGRPFDEFFRTEIAEPLGADCHFGLDPGESARVAALWPPDEALPAGPSEMAHRAFSELNGLDAWIDPALHGAVFPAGSVIANGRALARVGSIVANNGTVDGQRFLSEEVITDAATEQSYREDEALGPVRYGLGFGLHSDDYAAPTPTTLHWGGYGGSFLTMDPDSGVSCGFAPNRLRNDGGPRQDERRIEYWQLLGEISARLD